jgi:hypothetical protein
MFLDLLDPDSDPLVRGTDPDPSIIKQEARLLFDFLSQIAGSGSISQRHGSADPDPYQNVIDPQHYGIFYVSTRLWSDLHQSRWPLSS